VAGAHDCDSRTGLVSTAETARIDPPLFIAEQAAYPFLTHADLQWPSTNATVAIHGRFGIAHGVHGATMVVVALSEPCSNVAWYVPGVS
jgi:hypothetical protein